MWLLKQPIVNGNKLRRELMVKLGNKKGVKWVDYKEGVDFVQ